MSLLDRLLDERAAKAFVVLARSSSDPSLAPFVGPAQLGSSILIHPRGGAARLAYFSPMEREEAAASGLELITPEDLDVVRWVQDGYEPVTFLVHVLERALQHAGLAPGQLALAGRFDAGTVVSACARLAGDGWSFVAGETLGARLRKHKDAYARAEIQRAADGAGEALRRVAELLAAAGVADDTDKTLWLGGERLRIGRLRGEIATVLARHGLEQPEGNIVAAGRDGAVPHTTGDDDRVLRPGESLIVDLFPRGRLFADVTRTFCIGPPPEPLAEAHAAVRHALDAARDAARSGVAGWDVQNEVCAVFDRRGYPTPISHPGTERGYVHGLGHGVGWEIHEYPSFRRESGAGVLEDGDVFTLEPGLYDPVEGWAVRLEDLHALVGDELELLTPLPYELDPRGWTAAGGRGR